MLKQINVTVWNEQDVNQAAYPEGIHTAIAKFLNDSGKFHIVRTATLSQPDHGLQKDVLDDTDVLIWWAHCYHHMVSDDIVARVQQRVLDGMGLIVLHSGHAAKVFSRLIGTRTDKLRWREIGERERVWTIEPNHPIAAGIPEYIDIPETELYGECFQIPPPDELIFISWYQGGDVFRSGCTFKRGFGKIFFFSPGHESFLIYDMPEIQRVIINAAEWACPISYPVPQTGHSPEPLEKI